MDTNERVADDVSVEDCARLLELSVGTTAKLVERGDIPSRLTTSGERRLCRADVDAWIARRARRRAALTDLVQTAEQEEPTTLSPPPHVDSA